MRWLLFLSRLAFICNVFFVLGLSLQLFHWLKNEEARSTIFILGYFMALLVNPAANLCYFFLFFLNRVKLRVVPTWLLAANSFFLILQLIFLIYRNGR